MKYPLRRYAAILSVSGVSNLLAPDDEHAAWQALALAQDRGEELIDVKETNEQS